jgi:N-acyl-D-amino-acid deacylase
MKLLRPLGLALMLPAALAGSDAPFDAVIRGGTVYDGTGGPPRRADVGIRGDRIAAVGDLAQAPTRAVVDARGLAVAPGFINMLSWSNESLIEDGRSQGEVRQGVTTQIMGEGWSMGPVNDTVRRFILGDQADIRYDVSWSTLGEYLTFLERRGVAQNVASFVGATTIRQYVIGEEDRAPTPEELERMRDLVKQAMEEGALGVGSSLIYAPASYSTTEELIELCKVAARYKGKYISHMRNEADRVLEAVDELVRISREAGLPAEIYHLKLAGQANWGKLDGVVARVEAARKEGLAVTADMYTYIAGSTSFGACLPRWSLEGGLQALLPRLADPATRARIQKEMQIADPRWENICLNAGTPDRILLVGFKSEALKPLTGQTLAQIAQQRGTDPWQTILDLIREDGTMLGVVFFQMSEENVRRQIQLPWVSFGSDAASMAPEGVFLQSSTHPRAYGNFARLLGRYVREEKLISLPEAVRRLSALPATNLGLAGRGFLKPGMYADVAVFDPATIADRATFERPHQYAVGMKHVFVNGVQALKDGEHTGATPGRALFGPGRISLTRRQPETDASLEALEREVARLAEGAGGPVGVSALHLETGRRVSLRGGERFPMASTFKVPVAVQLLARVDAGELSLDQMLTLRPRDLHPGSGTLTDLFKRPGVSLSLRNLLELMLLISDNSATDLLLEAAGGAGAVTARMRTLGIEGIDVSRPTVRLIADYWGATLPPESEWTPGLFAALDGTSSPEQRKAAAARFDADPRDTATPDAMADLLARIARRELHGPDSAALLIDILERCQTGEARLKGILPAGTTVAHKTGTIGGSTNDVGLVTLPQGAGHVAVAVFVRSSQKEIPARERTIAEIARAVHDYFVFRPHP